VRRFAREIGIDIHKVNGTGPGGRISIDDVKVFAKSINEQISKSGGTYSLGVQPESLPDFSKWGDVERKTMSNIRRKTAEHLSYAWSSIPHVTQYDKADITDLEVLRKKFAKQAEAAGGKLTVTVILLKIIASALKKFPELNASVDMSNKEIIYKNYINIGIAVDTDRGLLVPVIRDVDKKNIIELAAELAEISEKARDKKLSLDEMQGGNFSISNLGGIGGTYFTPIINSPEAAILGVSRGSKEAVLIDNEFVPRLMLPLSLSYDHRIIDGADAARFIRWVSQALENPFLLSLEG
jgi:pyruvate dehydrogenase E2 component (dihydrolipoamide acetyltransferase)